MEIDHNTNQKKNYLLSSSTNRFFPCHSNFYIYPTLFSLYTINSSQTPTIQSRFNLVIFQGKLLKLPIHTRMQILAKKVVYFSYVALLVWFSDEFFLDTQQIIHEMDFLCDLPKETIFFGNSFLQKICVDDSNMWIYLIHHPIF